MILPSYRALRSAPVGHQLLGALLLGLVLVALMRVRRQRGRDVHHRGARIETASRSRRRLRRVPGLGTLRPISLATVAIAPLEETKHFKLIGTTGTGKSTAIAELIGGALGRGDRAVIADPDGKTGRLNQSFCVGTGTTTQPWNFPPIYPHSRIATGASGSGTSIPPFPDPPPPPPPPPTLPRSPPRFSVLIR